MISYLSERFSALHLTHKQVLRTAYCIRSKELQSNTETRLFLRQMKRKVYSNVWSTACDGLGLNDIRAISGRKMHSTPTTKLPKYFRFSRKLNHNKSRDWKYNIFILSVFFHSRNNIKQQYAVQLENLFLSYGDMSTSSLSKFSSFTD